MFESEISQQTSLKVDNIHSNHYNISIDKIFTKIK